MAQKTIRVATLTIEHVMPLLQVGPKTERVDVHDGVHAHVGGLRLSTFKAKGIQCVSCGIVGKFFALEVHKHAKLAPGTKISPHLNLYAVRVEEGIEVEILMTHDHIKPRSAGGADTLDNTQTMCFPCNFAKGKEDHSQPKPIDKS